ncbi:hypothetical protein FS837_004923 [Tulasnella sp. UAMH 9824]|nr:hypothetical protein FS837_004923 [Tulasnella sp. UAMH 9824]
MDDPIPSTSLGRNGTSDKDTTSPSRAKKAKPQTSPSLAYTSYNNLVSLANAQEGLMESGKKLVWRDPGEPPVILETLRECLVYALRGGFRAAGLAYGIRSGINLFLTLFTLLKRPKKFRFALIRHALFGEEPRRFAAMLGVFAALYKFILNSLPIIIRRWTYLRKTGFHTPTEDSNGETDLEANDEDSPLEMKSRRNKLSSQLSKLASTLLDSATSSPSSPQRPPHLSSSTQASLQLAREKGYKFDAWHAALAGSIAAGVAILFERPKSRTAVGQQMFVRGLQGLYNAWSRKTGIVIPYGSVVVFWLCCGQILYSFLLNPHTLAPTYDAWIQGMSNAPLEAVLMNRSLVNTGKFDPELLQTIVDGRSKPWKAAGPSIITPASLAGMKEQLKLARQGIFGPQVVSCEAIHPHRDACIPNIFMKVVECSRMLLPVYGALYLIPAILFKRKALFKQPWHSALRIIIGTVRSSTFIGVFVGILQAGFCALRHLNSPNLPPKYRELGKRLAGSQLYWWFFSSLSGLSLLVEDPHRREELAMYVLPKAGESAWITFREEVLGIKTRRKGAWKADVALSSLGMGMVMTIYQTNPAALSGLVRRILYQFIGPN